MLQIELLGIHLYKVFDLSDCYQFYNLLLLNDTNTDDILTLTVTFMP